MVQGGAGVTAVSDGVYGLPVTRRPVTGLDVAAGTPPYSSADLANASFTGLCQTCHTTANYYNQTTFTALASHNAADTQRCTACHEHQGDFGASCNACHGFPPPDSPSTGSTVTWTSDKAATPASLGDHTTHATYVTGPCFSTCHVGTTHLTNKTAANMGVKAATAAASTGVYKYSTVDNFDAWVGGALAGNVSVTDDRCANVNCHNSTYGAPANQHRSAANPSYPRYWNQNFNCYACHGYDGVAAAAPRPTADVIASGSHTKHVGTGEYALACTNCHPSAGYTNSHKSGSVNFAVNLGQTRVAAATGGQYDLDGITPFTTVTPLTPRENGGTGYFCTNVYCHSRGEPRGAEAIAYANATRWTSAATGACGTCHAVDGVAGTLTTNVHEKHVGAAAGEYGYACTACHAAVVGGVKPAYTIAGKALHVNGVHNLDFGLNEGTYALAAGGTVGAAGGTCTATYCHSRGLDRSAPYTQVNNAPRLEPDWDMAVGALGCNGCHGDAAAPYPSYANNTTVTPGGVAHTKKNSHAQHGNYECRYCHAATAGAGNVIAAVANHANRAWDLLAGAGATFTVAVPGTLSDAAYTPTTCNTISCHGGGNAQWGATLGCAACHAGASDVDDFAFNNGTMAMVSTGEWAAAGHGAGAAYPSTNPGAAFAGPAGDPNGCAYCHAFLGTAQNPLVTHGQGTNPFRLVNQGLLVRGATSDGGWNDACLVCHMTGKGPYDPDGAAAGYASRTATKKVDQNHYGSKHTVATKGGTFCWDCHDPHGDTQHYMVQSGNGSGPGKGVTLTSDGTYGVPVASRPVEGFDVTAGGYTSADLVKAATGTGGTYNGLCQTCHTNAAALNWDFVNNAAPPPGTGAGNHYGYDTQLCTACHEHRNGFSPNCSQCHGDSSPGGIGGMPPTAPTAARGGSPALAWPATVDPATGSPTNVGDHRPVTTTTPPVLYGSHEPFSCVECHTDTPGVGATHNDGGVNATMTNIAVRQGWTGAGGPLAAAWSAGALNGGAAGGSVTDDSCSNINCHSPYYQANAHRSGTPTPYTRYWINSTRWDCYTCHGYDGVAATTRPTKDRVGTGSHVTHLLRDFEMIGGSYPCAACHADHAGNLWHKDGVLNVPFSAGPAQLRPYGPVGVYSQNGVAPTDNRTAQGSRAYGTCTNVYCHSSVQSSPPGAAPTYATVTWGGTVACGNCHNNNWVHGGAGAIVQAMTSGSHGKHTSVPYSYNCSFCHNSAGDGTGGACVDCHLPNNVHVDGKIDLPLQATLGSAMVAGVYDTDNNLGTDEARGLPGAAYGRCGTVYCHSTGEPRGPQAIAYASAITWGVAGGAACGACHGVDRATGAMTSNVHAKHTAWASGDATKYAYTCDKCHSGVATWGGSSYTIASATLHVNGSHDLNLGLNLGTYAPSAGGTVGTAGGTCTATYCHSRGLDRSAPYTQVNNAPRVEPDWDIAPATLGCTGCHGDAAVLYPNYANNTTVTPGSVALTKKNSHARHGNYECRYCHAATAGAGNVIATAANHANQAWNLQAGAGATFTVAVQGTISDAAYTPTTCNTISCHGGGNAQWGASLGCNACHLGASDVDDFVFGNGTTAVVNTTEWQYSGHGKRTGTYDVSASPAAALYDGARTADLEGCAYCHDFSVTHGVAGNPFRLANRSGTQTAENGYGWNNACLVCHQNADDGYDPDGAGTAYGLKDSGREVDENHYGAKHATTEGGQFCWDCHDPHGDRLNGTTGNIYMVHAQVSGVNDNAYGVPVTANLKTVTFTKTTLPIASGYYVENTNSPRQGICQACHDPGKSGTQSAKYWRWDGTDDPDGAGGAAPTASAHNAAGVCTSCHEHTKDFGASCDACHGFPPPAAPFSGTTATWTSDDGGVPATVGAHTTHASGGSPYVSGDCNSTCHVATNHLTDKTSANMGVKAATAAASTGVYKYSTVDNFDAWVGGALAGNQSVVDDNCLNVNCHQSTYSANTFRSAANPTYRRYWVNTLDCYTCHAYDGVAATLNARPTLDVIATGSHTQHVGAGEYALACTNCHPSAGYTNSHKSGSVNFAANFGQTRVATATGGQYDDNGLTPFATVTPLTPRENGGTGYFCTNVYCHSRGEPRGTEAIVYANATRWTSAASGACGTCHAVDGVAGTLTSNVHEKHVGAVAGEYGYACTACHAAVVGGVKPAYTIASKALHVNGAHDLDLGANEGTYSPGLGGTVGAAGGTCTATYCHSRGLDRSAPYTQVNNAPRLEPDWDMAAGALACNGCHGDAAVPYPNYANNTTVTPGSVALTKKNSHARHGNYECRYCHAATAGAGNVIATATNHANRAWNLQAGAGATFTVAVPGTISDAAYTPTTCNTISCHGGGNAQWGASLGCNACHLGASDVDDFVFGN
ncbi:MAG: CxxxxCH/CxxCH domain c-type cytochrome, partial [Deferrisomatales bacterium]